MTATAESYHYTECGLDNIYLVGGFEIGESPTGRYVTINDIDGLHKTIGQCLIHNKKDLDGDEIRFLRHELGLSQMLLANLLDVSGQAINRWERGKNNINKPAEALIRVLYAEHIKDMSGVKKMLRRTVNLEDQMDEPLTLRKRSGRQWEWQTISGRLGS